MNSKKEESKKSWRNWGGILSLFLPLLKLGKAGGTIWSMFLMIGAYALIFPWSFAIGVVAMIFIHEMGHVLAARKKGIPVSAPAFIPFVGALITMKRQPLNAEQEAYLAFGGPFIGTIGALGAFGLGVFLESPALLAIAQIGFFLNLLNLIPIHPLDGGRIVTAISRWLWVVGLVGGLLVILYIRAYVFLVFWGVFAWELYKKYVRKDEPSENIGETTLVISTPEEKFLENDLPIPTESYRRELFFIQCCDMRTKTEELHIYYPGIGHISTITVDMGLIKQMTLIKTKHKHELVEMRLALRYESYPGESFSMFQDEEYYEVSTRARVSYGLSYIGLAAFLSWMMFVTNQLLQLPIAR